MTIDPIARLRSIDPGGNVAAADRPEAAFEQILARARMRSSHARLPKTLPRVGLVVAVLVAVGLFLPTLAIGTSPFRLLGREPVVAAPVNGLIVAQGVDALYVIDPKTDGVLKLAKTAEMGHPAWSPDGRFLAVDRTENGTTDVYTIWPNGTHPQLIMRDASAPAWADDGTRIFVQRDTCTAPGGCESSEDDTTVVYSVAVDGSEAHEVGDDDYDVSETGWPPGQNVLAFLDEDGSATAAAPTSVDSAEAAWSPDGTQLVFADPPSGIWLVDEDGKVHLVVKGAFSSPAWGTARVDGPAASRVTGR